MLVDIGLVDFVGHEQDALFVTDLNYFLKAVSLQDLASRVSWVNDDHGSDLSSMESGVSNNLSELIGVQTPALVFIEIVRDQSALLQGHLGRV